MTVVEIYTDGACSGNPGPGGWGVLLRYRGHEKELCGGDPGPTTNNRMELMAAIQALEGLTRPTTVRLHTDSVYVRSGITSWLAGWKRNGWQTKDRKPVKNADLWQRLDSAAQRHRGRVALGQGPQRRSGKRARRRPGQSWVARGTHHRRRTLACGPTWVS